MKDQLVQKFAKTGKFLTNGLLTTVLLMAGHGIANAQSVSFGVEFGTPQSNGGPCVGKGSCDQAYDFDVTTGVYISSPDAVTVTFMGSGSNPVSVVNVVATAVTNVDSIVLVDTSLPAINNVLTMTFSLSELTQKQPDQVAYFTDPSQTYQFDAPYPLTASIFQPLGLLPNAIIEPTDETNVAINGDQVVVTFHYSYSSGKSSANNSSVASQTNNNTGNCSIAPNPANDVLTLNVNSSDKADHYRITNLVGQVLHEDAINSTSTTIDLTTLSSGMYLVNVFSGSAKIQTIKFVKQ